MSFTRLEEDPMRPSLVVTDSRKYVLTQADCADLLRDHLLRHGVPCSSPVSSDGSTSLIRLGATANVGFVQSILDQWEAPEATAD